LQQPSHAAGIQYIRERESKSVETASTYASEQAMAAAMGSAAVAESLGALLLNQTLCSATHKRQNNQYRFILR